MGNSANKSQPIKTIPQPKPAAPAANLHNNKYFAKPPDIPAVESRVDDNRGWQCSDCGSENPITVQICGFCRHQINNEPEAADQIIPDWNPTEGAMNDTDDEEEQLPHEGVVENPRPEGVVAEVVEMDDPDFSDTDDESEWSGMEEVGVLDTYKVDDEKKSFDEPKPTGLDQSWICSHCGGRNPILDFECHTCHHVTNYMRHDGADMVIFGKVELIAGEKPEAWAGHEVWQCPVCNFYNDFDQSVVHCSYCPYTAARLGELIRFTMDDDEYWKRIGLPRQKRLGEDHQSMFLLNDFERRPAIVKYQVLPSEYPMSVDPALRTSNQLGEMFGMPGPLMCFRSKTQEFWRDGVVVCPCFEIPQSAIGGRPSLIGRGFAVNENGWLAILTSIDLRVYKPTGTSFSCFCTRGFTCKGTDHPVRVRYERNIVYVYSQHTIFRFLVNSAHAAVIPTNSYCDDYIRQQNIQDIDVRDQFIATTWRKWIGLYHAENFNWFHAVSTTMSAIQPKSVVWKRSYHHVLVGSCIIAFHCASRHSSVLWVTGNLPDEDVSFCVSDHYGVFTLVNKQVVQSYYDAGKAQSICSQSCGNITPSPQSDYQPIRHIFHHSLRKPVFGNVKHIEYDESFGTKGRLLCWDEETCQMMMVVNRKEFVELETTFRNSFSEWWNFIGENLMERLDEEKQKEVQRVYEKFCVYYSEPFVQWFLRSVLYVRVFSSDGLAVFSVASE